MENLPAMPNLTLSPNVDPSVILEDEDYGLKVSINVQTQAIWRAREPNSVWSDWLRPHLLHIFDSVPILAWIVLRHG